MPAAAVIPAPIAYIIVVAVKKLIIGTLRNREACTAVLVDWLSHPSVNGSRH